MCVCVCVCEREMGLDGIGWDEMGSNAGEIRQQENIAHKYLIALLRLGQLVGLAALKLLGLDLHGRL